MVLIYERVWIRKISQLGFHSFESSYPLSYYRVYKSTINTTANHRWIWCCSLSAFQSVKTNLSIWKQIENEKAFYSYSCVFFLNVKCAEKRICNFCFIEVESFRLFLANKFCRQQQILVQNYCKKCL